MKRASLNEMVKPIGCAECPHPKLKSKAIESLQLLLLFATKKGAQRSRRRDATSSKR
jgi:hypothetical protein